MGTCTISESKPQLSSLHTALSLRLGARREITFCTLTAGVPRGHLASSSAGTSSACQSRQSVASMPLIPRYIFVNMFTGVVVESFAYVYQMPGQASLNREDIRKRGDMSRFDDRCFQKDLGGVRHSTFRFPHAGEVCSVLKGAQPCGVLPALNSEQRLTGALELRPYPPASACKVS